MDLPGGNQRTMGEVGLGPRTPGFLRSSSLEQGIFGGRTIEFFRKGNWDQVAKWVFFV